MSVTARSVRAEPAPTTPVERVAVVGAGVSGIVTARVLAAVGFHVTVFEKSSDVGGVWSASRAYPGIATQDDRTSYVFSDSPMPQDVVGHPSGADVQAYLDRYLRAHGVHEHVRLETTVTSARLVDDRTWQIESEGPEGGRSERFDWLIAANGAFSTPFVPSWPGREEFEQAGGRVVAPAALADGAVLDGARTVVVGWGKTACDVAAIAADRSASTAVIARTVMWKLPKRIGGRGLTFRHLILTRAGERLITGAYRTPSGRLMLTRLAERVPRVLLGRAIARTVDRASGLTALGLLPTADIRSSNSLVTEGFFEAVADGRIRVHRERTVARLGADADGPFAVLSDGERLSADVVVAATGYEQQIEFLAVDVLERARTDDGALLLHRRTLGVDLPRFALVGWAHSYRSPLTSEIAAVWLAGVMTGAVDVPSPDRQRAGADRFRLTRSEAIGARTGALPGVTMGDLDRMLAEVGAPLPLRVRLRQTWRPIDPADYLPVLSGVLTRLRSPAVAGRAARRA